MMKFVLTLVAMLICVHAYGVPYSNWPTSLNAIPYGAYDNARQASLPPVERIAQPILQAVLVRQPEYGGNLELHRLLAQALAAHEADEQGVLEETSVESSNRGASIVSKDGDSSEDLSNRKDRRRGGEQGNIENERRSEDRRSSDSRRSSGSYRRSEDRQSIGNRRSVKKQDSSEDRDSSEIRSISKNRGIRKDHKSSKVGGSGEERRKTKVRNSNEERSSVEERESSGEVRGSSESERSRVENVVALTARQGAELGNVAPVCILYGNYGPYAGQ